VVAGALTSVRHLKVSQIERARHQERARTLKKRLAAIGLPLLNNPSHIVPVLVGDPVRCKVISDRLLKHHRIYIQPINYPTVPRGSERLRLTPTPQHSDADLDHLCASLAKVWARREVMMPRFATVGPNRTFSRSAFATKSTEVASQCVRAIK
jgi:5-aminolevulinate synthase